MCGFLYSLKITGPHPVLRQAFIYHLVYTIEVEQNRERVRHNYLYPQRMISKQNNICLFGSSWLSAGSYICHLICGYLGWVSYLLYSQIVKMGEEKNIWFWPFKYLFKIYDNCVLLLTDLN